MWNTYQRQRLAFEEALLRHHSLPFSFRNRPRETYVEGWHTTALDGRRYQLRLNLPSEFPDEQPRLFVTCPFMLWLVGGSTSLASLGTSHAYHLRDNGPRGPVEICHTLSWDASITVLKVLMMGMIWLEGWSSHLSCGETIDDYLKRNRQALSDRF